MVSKTGKKVQVLFEPALRMNNYTQEFEIASNLFTLWADKGLKETIESVEGVMQVSENVLGYPFYYALAIDPRYDIEFVKKEVEATVILKVGEI